MDINIASVNSRKNFCYITDYLHYVKSFSLFLQYTINSKKVEVAVKKIISGGDIKQRGALANPSSLDLYYNIPELALPNN